MLTDYLHQTCVLRRKTGTDARGQPVYAANASVSCRKQAKTQNVLSTDGQAVKSQTVYYLSESVSVGDSIDGKTVLTVESMVDLYGSSEGYKAVI